MEKAKRAGGAQDERRKELLAAPEARLRGRASRFRRLANVQECQPVDSRMGSPENRWSGPRSGTPKQLPLPCLAFFPFRSRDNGNRKESTSCSITLKIIVTFVGASFRIRRTRTGCMYRVSPLYKSQRASNRQRAVRNLFRVNRRVSPFQITFRSQERIIMFIIKTYSASYYEIRHDVCIPGLPFLSELYIFMCLAYRLYSIGRPRNEISVTFSSMSFD